MHLQLKTLCYKRAYLFTYKFCYTPLGGSNWLLYTFLFLFSLVGPTPSIAQSLFSNDTVNTIDIHFFDPNWDMILDGYITADLDDKVLCTMTINGTVYDSVGIKYKGNSSYQANNAKNPFTVELDYIISNQDIEGYSIFKLNNGFKDPSFTRETFGYELAGNYMTAPKAGYARVYIDGNYHGLYTTIQGITKDFCYANYYEDNGTLVKSALPFGPQQPVPGCSNLAPALFNYLGNDTTCYTNRYELKSDYGWSKIRDLCDTLNNQFNQVEKVLNIDRWLWLAALDNLLVNLDSPINNSNNYYAYQDPREQFHIMPWDLNEVFGVFRNLNGGGPGPGTQLNTLQLQQFDPFYQSTNTNFPALNLVLSNPRYRKMYVAHYKTILQDHILNNNYLSRIDSLQSTIYNAVVEDVNKFYSNNDFTNNINITSNGIIGISELMNNRSQFISQLPEFSYIQPTISILNANPIEQDPNTSFPMQVEISNATEAFIFFKDNVWETYNSIQLYDDGQHNDLLAGDGIYGNIIPLSISDMAYYIYAENNNAGIFEPKSAAHTYHTIPVKSGVVINEFMANNGSIMDEYGEYDDWLELYNTNDFDVSLLGFFISDRSDETHKWRVPAITLAAHDYLVLWTDSDPSQGDTHTNFKLDADGESIYLSDELLHITDSISFPPQDSINSYGRYPNGTGEFIPLLPSIGSENNTDSCIGVVDCEGVCNGNAQVDACGICNGLGPTIWYFDGDGDGLGTPNNSLTACDQPTSYIANNTDIDDDCYYNFYDCESVCGGPSLEDICGVCNGVGELTWYLDSDNDGFGEPENFIMACAQPLGYVSNSDEISGTGQPINTSLVQLFCSNNTLNVLLSNYTTSQVNIINQWGSLIKSINVSPGYNKILLVDMPAGIYFAQPTLSGEVVKFSIIH